MLVNEAPDGLSFRLREWFRAPIALTASICALINHVLTDRRLWVLSHAYLSTALIKIVVIYNTHLCQDANTPVDSIIAIKVNSRVLIRAVVILLLRVNSVWAHVLSFLHRLLPRVFNELTLDQSDAIRVDYWQYVVNILNQQILESRVSPHDTLMDEFQSGIKGHLNCNKLSGMVSAC